MGSKTRSNYSIGWCPKRSICRNDRECKCNDCFRESNFKKKTWWSKLLNKGEDHE